MEYAGLRQALLHENPLQIVGTINAYTALLAKNAGFNAIYLSGAGTANAYFGLPDLGITTFTDTLNEVSRITAVCNLPLLVDADTGWGNAFSIERAVKLLIRAGATGIHIEDQVTQKRCGHRPNKQLVDTDEMCDRIKAAQDANISSHFTIMARTDALQNEGLIKTLARIEKYILAGADMIFLEGATELAQYTAVTKTASIPVLANMTEFGMSPLFDKEALKNAGVQLILYPLSAFRAMNKAAMTIYETIRTVGTQQSVIETMETRAELYKNLNYLQYETKLDQLFAQGENK